MSITACSFAPASSPRYQDLASCIEDVLAMTTECHFERREGVRHPFTRPVTLIPCDPAGSHCGEGILCMGKEISAKGFGFFHHRPLPHRYLLLSFAPTSDCPSRLLMRMKRCRFLGESWYESGAQFVRVLPEIAEVTDIGFDD